MVEQSSQSLQEFLTEFDKAKRDIKNLYPYRLTMQILNMSLFCFKDVLFYTRFIMISQWLASLKNNFLRRI
jgi:hypothetical protein